MTGGDGSQWEVSGGSSVKRLPGHSRHSREKECRGYEKTGKRGGSKEFSEKRNFKILTAKAITLESDFHTPDELSPRTTQESADRL